MLTGTHHHHKYSELDQNWFYLQT